LPTPGDGGLTALALGRNAVRDRAGRAGGFELPTGRDFVGAREVVNAFGLRMLSEP